MLQPAVRAVVPASRRLAGDPATRRWVGIAAAPVAALAVHELRYFLAPAARGGDHGPVVAGHDYIGLLIPWLAVGFAIGLGLVLVRIRRAWSHGSGGSAGRPAFLGMWLMAAAGLMAIYLGQELLEGFLTPGRATGLAAVLGGGGMWAVPAALLAGLALALLTRCAEEAVLLAARLGRRRLLPAHPPVALTLLRSARVHRPAPMAASAAGRAPPEGPVPTFRLRFLRPA